jgi:hypothetical protein
MATFQDPADSSQNPDNAFLRLSRYAGEAVLRPDLYYDGETISAVFKPRFTSRYEWWEDGTVSGEREGLNRANVNEWRAQVAPHESLFLSFGKEKLLWGPSFLASPSNILFEDTERQNPKSEVEGKYLARVIYLPGPSFTLTALGRTQRDDAEPPVRALKADWVGTSASFSLIGYFRQDDRLRIGSYGQWTASDALLLYYDGIVTRGTDALYPALDTADPLGGSFLSRYDGSGRFFSTVTAGGAYTFLSGSTASIEFLYNGPGYGDADAAAYYALRRNAHDHYFDAGPLAGLSQSILAQTAVTGLSFLRRYYLMGQYQVREIGNELDIVLRYVHGIEERAGQASTIAEWRITDRMQLFNINMMSIDRGRETEFNAAVDRSFLAGIEISF